MSARSGTLTFLYTDIVSSSKLWNNDPRLAESFVERHNLIVRESVEQFDGEVCKSLGDGLASVFESAHQAVLAAALVQQVLQKAWNGLAPPTNVRVAVHSGQATRGSEDYNGVVLNRLSRILDIAQGNQVLISGTTWLLAAEYVPKHLTVVDLGEFELLGNERPERLFQLQAPGLPQDFQPPKRLSPKHNLTSLNGPFLGRQTERADIGGALNSPGHRLITILGFGGIGKTTLAQQCAWDALEFMPDGVWWIDCESARSEEQLNQETCFALDIPLDPIEPDRGLWDALKNKRCLLVFDCFEGVVAHADTLGKILKHCPQVRILVTSRVVLGLTWEKQFELRGMLQGKRSSASQDAIALFVESAKHANPEFALTKSNKKVVARIVESLEGVPLALVLVAGRLRHMSLDETASQLQQSLLKTARSIRKDSGRHSGLRRVIDSSLRLLPEIEQETMSVLSVFVGGFTLEAARELLGKEKDTVASLSLLRDHSLLVAQTQGQQTRYKQLDSVQEYMVEHLLDDSRNRLLERHRDVYLQIALGLRHLFDSGKSAEASKRLSTEAANFRRAILTAINTGHSDSIAEFGRSLARVYFEAGLLTDFARVSVHADVIAQSRGDLRLATELLGLQGMAARRSGDMESAKSYWERRLQIFETLGDREGQANTLSDLVDLVNNGSQPQLARGYLRLLARHVKASKNTSQHMVLKMHEALFHLYSGDLRLASRAADECMSHGLESMSDYDLSSVCRGLGEVYRSTKAYHKSYSLLLKALEHAAKGQHSSRAARFLFEIVLTSLESDDKAVAVDAMFILDTMPKSATTSVQTKYQDVRSALEPTAIAEKLVALTNFDKTRPWDQLVMSFVDHYHDRM